MVRAYNAPRDHLWCFRIGVDVVDRLSVEQVGCWVIKSKTPTPALDPDWATGSPKELDRCLRRSYRVGLMQPGQPCLLWVSGRLDPGVQAVGRLASAAEPRSESESQVSVRLHRLSATVPRAALLADHVLANAEVIRMPAGSNPSYLSPRSWAALRDYLDPADLALLDRP